MPKMRTSFQGLVKLLARSLYPEPDVFIRELIQNAHDSIQLRRIQEPPLAGEIRIFTDPDSRTISFLDNGTGMGQREIEDFLSTIGSTGTGTRTQELAARDIAVETIGQFGIGLLSAFVVAERIDVYTRKPGSQQVWHWVNHGGEDYQLEALDAANQPPGSRVVVTVAADQLAFIDDKAVRKTVKHYADFLPFPIYLNEIGPVNAVNAPWHQDHWNEQQDYLKALEAFLNQRYTDKPLHVIPVALESPHARGALYIAQQNIPGVNASGVVDIFQERMCIRLNDQELLPDWARFVRGVIDSADLQPTAARDNLIKEKSYYRLRQHLGESILESLIRLAETERPRFLKLCNWHHHHLKGMAVHNEAFYQAVIDILPFETNLGNLTLKEYVQRQSPPSGQRRAVYFFTHDHDANQFYELCQARGLIAINAGRQFDEVLIRRYVGRHLDTLELKQLDILDDPALYESLDESEQAAYVALEQALQKALEQAGMDRVRPSTRRFLPKTLNAVLVSTRRIQAFDEMEQLLGRPFLLEGLEELARDVRNKLRQQPLDLFLNADNPLIQRLREREDIADPGYQPLLIGIYNCALLNARYRLTTENVRIFHTQLQALMHDTLDLQTQFQNLSMENARLRHLLEQAGLSDDKSPTYF